MRKHSAAQVETREIADNELDNVSGGILGINGIPNVGSLLPTGPVAVAAGVQIDGPVMVQAGISGVVNL